MTDIFAYTAIVYSQLGDFDHALAAFEPQRAARDTSIPWAKTPINLHP